jgi:hypothetical protein
VRKAIIHQHGNACSVSDVGYSDKVTHRLPTCGIAGVAPQPRHHLGQQGFVAVTNNRIYS